MKTLVRVALLGLGLIAIVATSPADGPMAYLFLPPGHAGVAELRLSGSRTGSLRPAFLFRIDEQEPVTGTAVVGFFSLDRPTDELLRQLDRAATYTPGQVVDGMGEVLFAAKDPGDVELELPSGNGFVTVLTQRGAVEVGLYFQTETISDACRCTPDAVVDAEYQTFGPPQTYGWAQLQDRAAIVKLQLYDVDAGPTGLQPEIEPVFTLSPYGADSTPVTAGRITGFVSEAHPTRAAVDALDRSAVYTVGDVKPGVGTVAFVLEKETVFGGASGQLPFMPFPGERFVTLIAPERELYVRVAVDLAAAEAACQCTLNFRAEEVTGR